jgi:L-alanine-DL-glutamate epimerase-like enolase superfamily enzyme
MPFGMKPAPAESGAPVLKLRGPRWLISIACTAITSNRRWRWPDWSRSAQTRRDARATSSRTCFSCRRDTTPEEEIDYLKKLLADSGAKALKFRVGGRMSENEDAIPDRTEKLIPLVRKTFGDAMDIHADANSSYDPKEAIRVGHMLEAIKVVHYEEPGEFDHFGEMKMVADALTVPVPCGKSAIGASAG